MFWTTLYRLFMFFAGIVFFAVMLTDRVEGSIRALALGLAILTVGLAIKPIPRE